MAFVRRAADGAIVAVSKLRPKAEEGAGWSELADDDAELQAWGKTLLAGATELAVADLEFIRVLEDLIDLLQARGLIAFTDLPLPAQNKLLERRQARSRLNGLRLIDDEEQDELML